MDTDWEALITAAKAVLHPAAFRNSLRQAALRRRFRLFAETSTPESASIRPVRSACVRSGTPPLIC